MSKKDLNDLRRDRKAAADTLARAADTIGTLEVAETRDDVAITAAVATFETAKAAFDAADAAVKRQEAVETAQAAAAVSGDLGAGRGAAPGSVAAQPINPADKGVEIGMAFHAIANAKGDVAKAADALDKMGHSGVSAALSGATESAGGVTIPRPMAAQVIELLRARVVMRRAGVRTMPMPAGQLRHAKQTGSATASYGAESGVITASEPTFDKIDQSFKTLSALVPVGNALLRHSGVEVFRMVRDDLIAVQALREDLAFLRNDGTGNLPKGAVSWCPAGNNIGATAATAAAAEAGLRSLINKVETANVDMTNCGFVMHPAAKNWLAGLRDANGFYLFPSLQTGNTVLGYPIYTTTQLPTNLGAGTNGTEVMFLNFAEYVIGDSMTLSFATSTEASYWNGSAYVSAFATDQTLMRSISEHDLAPMHDVATSMLIGTAWAA